MSTNTSLNSSGSQSVESSSKGNKHWLKHALLLLKHELKRGELTIILLAIVLAVSAVFSLSGFSSHIKRALINESTTFIAADRVLESSRPIAPDILTEAERNAVVHAQQLEMSSIVFAGNNMALADLSAVSAAYPLRGELLVSDSADLADAKPVNAPARGEAWIAVNGLKQLEISVGDEIEVGGSTFKVAGVISQIPNASFSVFTSGPQVFINIDDIAQTELVQPGSRLSYSYLFAGEPSAIESFEDWLKPQVNETQRWIDIESGQSPLAGALNRAQKYLSLASMLGIVLAAVAVAVASRRYSQRHQPSVAIFKAMGASKAYITKLYCLHWSLLSIVSISIGLLVGYGILQVGLSAMAEQVELDENYFAWYPFIVAIITGLICALAFAIEPLKSLVATKPLSILRGYQDENRKAWLNYLPAFVALFTLLFVFSRDLMLSVALLAGGLIVVGILLLFSRVLINAGRRAGSQAGKSWHLAMANLQRRAKENSVQLISFTIAIKLLLLIVVMKNALIDEWQQQLPDNAANRFLVNISGQQIDRVNEFLSDNNIVSSGLYPVVRGRLTAINDERVARRVSKEEDEEADNGRRGVGRELNLTWRASLPTENEVIDGSWWSEQDQKTQVSIEQGVAERLDIGVGDTLTFQLGSEEFSVPVTSVREVNWQALQPNFFMIFSPQVLADFPATYITSLYVEPSKKELLQDFLSQYPTISMIDVDALINQLRSVIDKVSIAVEFILVLVVLAGSLVLVAQVQASMEERERELAILRTLGAKGSLLRNSVLFEFVALGALAGFMASVAMEIAVYVIQSRVFDMTVSLHLPYWLLGIVAGASFVGFIGLLSCWRLLNLSSVTLIRRTM
ncbi:FtsX-like permease family protein [Endozoicomonas sp. G2_1]|uniref:ABC transporter permease n=1 Tax=Endozoicomonas sp. G2_1 TaxID=2821091 RepID=UPI001ADAB7D4|nr:FtsX-like permease family protein [Endozoicomonas sp. G2_1]MBO9488815.1 FtsX-like permease family protein [Endozoicomonas sp. G2_1]